LNSINIFGAKTNETIWQAIEAGVPREKVSSDPQQTCISQKISFKAGKEV
jgi:hypothetical protein